MLSWPQDSKGHIVEEAESLNGPWQPVEGMISDVDGKKQIFVKPSSPVKVFRLR